MHSTVCLFTQQIFWAPSRCQALCLALRMWKWGRHSSYLRWDHILKSTREWWKGDQRGRASCIWLHSEVMVKHRPKAKAPSHCWAQEMLITWTSSKRELIVTLLGRQKIKVSLVIRQKSWLELGCPTDTVGHQLVTRAAWNAWVQNLHLGHQLSYSRFSA